LDENQQFRTCDPDTAIRSEGDKGEAVLTLPERATLALHNAHYAKRKPADVNLLIERVHIRKELVHQIHADHADTRIVLVVGVVQVPAELHLFAPDINETGRGGAQRDLVDDVALVTGGGLGLELRQGADLLV